MTVNQAGSFNATANNVPGLNINIVPPQNLTLQGVSTGRVGLVGSASWGPKNTLVVVGDQGDYIGAFGPIIARTYDMGTHQLIAQQNGAIDFRCVRVTDGTDVAAAATLLAAITFTGLYTGSLTNQAQITLAPGSAVGTLKATLFIPGQAPEVFDNVAGTSTTAWSTLAAAVNSGNGALRGPSQLFRAAATGTSVAIPATATTYPFVVGTGVTNVVVGTDGATTLTDQMLLGVDVTAARTGMYALRSSGCAIGVLCDVTSYSTFSAQFAYGLSEGTYMMCQDPAGSALSTTGITTAVANKQAAGIDSYGCKVLFGDWLYWYDPTNAVTRLVSPQAFEAGELASLDPNESSLNKQMVGILGSQKSGVVGSGAVHTYSTAELSALESGGFDVISNPQPGGSYWGARIGHNSSSQQALNGDNYTRMTNFLAFTLNSGMGIFVGQTKTPKLYLRINNTLGSFLAELVGEDILCQDDQGNNPYSIVCTATSNAASAANEIVANVNVEYEGINENFVINLQGGVTVTIAKTAGITSSSVS